MASRYAALPYDEALAQDVLALIEAGVLLRELWREPDLPTRGDLRRWRHADPTFEARVRAAVNAARGLRMTTYDPAVADRICLRLCAGESLKGVCRDPAMPCVATVFEWLKTQPDFVHGYNIARDMQADRLYDLGLRVWLSMKEASPTSAGAQAKSARRSLGGRGRPPENLTRNAGEGSR